MEKTPNYTPAQEALIVAAIAANGGVANKSVAESLVSNPEMNVDGRPRNVRSIIAKMTRMDGVTYERQPNARKDGSPVESKAKLVEQIAAAAGVTFEALDKAARGDLVKLRDVLAKAA